MSWRQVPHKRVDYHLHGDNMNDDEADRIADELEMIAERLNDLSMSMLSSAIERGESQRPANEKRVSQARRAVEKAIHHLRARQ